MTHILRTLLIAITFALAAPASIQAQASLKKIVESIEDSKSSVSTIYREKRDPSTRKVIDSEMLIVFTDQKLASRMIDAMKKERSNSVSYTIDNSTRTKMYSIAFDNGKGDTSSYSLYKNSSTQWTLSVKTSVRTSHTRSQSRRR